MWTIICAGLIATAALMLAAWDEASPVELHARRVDRRKNRT
jgi:hypothetical protein